MAGVPARGRTPPESGRPSAGIVSEAPRSAPPSTHAARRSLRASPLGRHRSSRRSSLLRQGPGKLDGAHPPRNSPPPTGSKTRPNSAATHRSSPATARARRSAMPWGPEALDRRYTPGETSLLLSESTEPSQERGNVIGAVQACCRGRTAAHVRFVSCRLISPSAPPTPSGTSCPDAAGGIDGGVGSAGRGRTRAATSTGCTESRCVAHR